MDNQLAKPEILLQRLSVTTLLILLAIFLTLGGFRLWQVSDPYVNSVLSLKGDAIQGAAIFQMNCAGCHGVTAQGKVGPSLEAVSKRKSSDRLIHQVISGKTPPMPQFQPNPQEMADLLRYLEKL